MKEDARNEGDAPSVEEKVGDDSKGRVTNRVETGVKRKNFRGRSIG